MSLINSLRLDKIVDKYQVSKPEVFEMFMNMQAKYVRRDINKGSSVMNTYIDNNYYASRALDFVEAFYKRKTQNGNSNN